MRVALCEERNRTRQELVSMLEESSIEVEPVTSIADLKRVLNQGSISAVIVGEPENESKQAVIRSIRQHGSATRLAIIAIVGDLYGPESVTLVDEGADDVFSLPITTEKLTETIRRSRWENTRDLSPAQREIRLSKPAQMLVELFSQARDGYFVATDQGEIVAASAGLVTLTGFDLDELVGETVAGLGLSIKPELADTDSLAHPQILSFTLVTSDWRKVPVIAELYEVRLAGIRCQFGIVREDVGETGVAPDQVRPLINAITRNSTDAILVVDRAGQIQYASNGFERKMGWDAAAIEGRNIIDFVAPEDYAVIQPFSSGGVVHSGQIEAVQLLQENGQLRAVNLSVTEIDSNPIVSGWLISIEDPASSRVNDTRRLPGGGYFSLYDPVTSLPNRILFIDRLDHAIERSARVNSVMCCLVVAIDDFETATEECSAADINQILCEASRRLYEAVREGDTIARIGDVEFAVLAEGVGGVAEARILGERISESLRKPALYCDQQLRLNVSIGAATSKPSGQNSGTLMRDAMAAMEASRQAGAGRLVIFEDRMRNDIVDSLKLEDDIDGLQDRGELQIFYQPEVDIRTDKISALEALIRWEHPRHGLILPNEFLSIGEATGQLDAIGLWIIESVCRSVQKWRSDYPSADSIVGVVNLTPSQVSAPNFIDSVADILARTGLPASNLRLEISESQVEGVEQWRRAAESLRALDIQVGLQDMNAASFNTELIEALPVDAIKIDRTAMNAVITNPSRPSQSTNLAQIASGGPEIIVVGVETAHHLARARIMGYQYGQGFYFYRPVPALTIEYLVSRSAQMIDEHVPDVSAASLPAEV